MIDKIKNILGYDFDKEELKKTLLLEQKKGFLDQKKINALVIEICVWIAEQEKK